MKKFLTVMLLAVGIIFASQFANVSTVSAEEIYVGSTDGVDYYITGSSGGKELSFTNALFAQVTAFENGEQVDVFGYVHSLSHPSSTEPVFQIVRGNQVSKKYSVKDSPLAYAVLLKILAK